MIDQDTINRLTIAATQRRLTDAELAEYLQLHAQMAITIADSPRALPGHGFQLSNDQRAVHMLNARQFEQAAEALTRLSDLDLAVVEMRDRGARHLATMKDPVDRALWEARKQAFEDVLALLRAGR